MYEAITASFLTVFILFVLNMVFMFYVKRSWSELHTWFTFITFLLAFTLLVTSIIVISVIEDLTEEDTLIFSSLGFVFPSIVLLVYAVLYIRDSRSRAALTTPVSNPAIVTVVKGGGKRRRSGK